MAEAFFSRLPPSRLTASETELRDCLLKAAAVAERLLPRTGAVPLQEWVERRIPGQVALATNADGQVTLTAGEAERGGGAAAAKPPRAQSQSPAPKASAGGPAGGGSSAAAEAFFSRLPTDSFSQTEEVLRAALKDVLTERGPLSASQVAAHPDVASAAKSTLIRAVTLVDWVERRIGSEVQVLTDERGVRTLQVTRQHESRDDKREAFFSTLPDGRFSHEEDALRSAIIDFLATWKSSELATLSNAGTDKGVQWAKANLFRGYDKAVTMREWIERRIGGEMELQQDSKGQQVIHVTASSRHLVAARFRELERLGAKGKGKGPEGRGPDDHAGQKGGVIRAAGVSGKGKGVAKGAITNGAASTLPKAERDATRKRFFDSLPEDRLEPPEQDLRQALLDFLSTWSGPAGQQHPFLTDLDKSKGVQDRKSTLLPPEVSLLAWITTRIGGELATKRDGGQVALMLREDLDAANADEPTQEDDGSREERKAEDASMREEKREAFFAALPQDGFSKEEQALRKALLWYMDSGRDHKPTLSGAGSDPQVRNSRDGVVPKGCGVTFRQWVDRRVGGEIETYEANNMIFLARRKKERHDRAEIESKKEAWFEQLPADGFTPEEEAMRDVLLSFLESFQGPDGAPPSLSNAGTDHTVRDARNALIPKNEGVSLRDWIDRRIGLEVETMQPEDGNGQIYFGLRGELEAKVLAMPKGISKRKQALEERLERGEDPKGKGSKSFKGDGKGKDKGKNKGKDKDERSVIGMDPRPVKRQRF